MFVLREQADSDAGAVRPGPLWGQDRAVGEQVALCPGLEAPGQRGSSLSQRAPGQGSKGLHADGFQSTRGRPEARAPGERRAQALANRPRRAVCRQERPRAQQRRGGWCRVTGPTSLQAAWGQLGAKGPVGAERADRAPAPAGEGAGQGGSPSLAEGMAGHLQARTHAGHQTAAGAATRSPGSVASPQPPAPGLPAPLSALSELLRTSGQQCCVRAGLSPVPGPLRRDSRGLP